MKYWVLFLVLIGLYAFFFHTGCWVGHIKADLNSLSHRFHIGSVEKHLVRTNDGFILELHRLLPIVPLDTSSHALSKRPVVWMQHGLFEDSLVWILASGHQSLPVRLVNSGIEVWLGNNRGNHFSSHPNHTHHDEAFWTDWSFHEMAISDWPTIMDHILKTTGVEQIIYVGQSQGAVQALIALSIDATSSEPHWNDKVRLFVALAPGGFVQIPTNPFIRFLFDYVNSGLFGRTFLFLSDDLFPHPTSTHRHHSSSDSRFSLTFDFLRYWTHLDVLGHMGETLISSLGFIKGDVDDSLRGEVYRNIPSGSTSIRNMEHWVQVAQSGELTPFNSTEPYPLRTITTP